MTTKSEAKREAAAAKAEAKAAAAEDAKVEAATAKVEEAEAALAALPTDIADAAALEVCNGQTILSTRGDARGFALVLSNGHTLHVKGEMTFQLE